MKRDLAGVVGLAAVLALVLAACGGGDSATATPPATAAATATALATPAGAATPGAATAPAATATPRQAATATAQKGAAKDGDTVTVKYRGTLDSGEVFDPGAQPLTFKVGSGQVIAGFNDAVKGMTVGQKKTVHLDPAQAYGVRQDSLVIDVPKSQVPQGVQKGSQLRLSDGRTAVVVEVTDTTVKIDANHPLAGKALNFDIEVVTIA